jgi:hypothetical protein
MSLRGSALCCRSNLFFADVEIATPPEEHRRLAMTCPWGILSSILVKTLMKRCDRENTEQILYGLDLQAQFSIELTIVVQGQNVY